MSVYFLRHIKTVNNQAKILSGRSGTEILPGQKVEIPDSCPHFTKVYCSTAERCRNTLAMVPETMIGADITFSDRLLERSLGVLEGMEKEKAIVQYPEYFVERRVGIMAQISGGETIEDVYLRVQPIAEKVMERKMQENILICSHNQTLKVIYMIVNAVEITDKSWHELDFPNGKIMKIL